MTRVLVTMPNQHWIHKTVARVEALLLKDSRYSVTLTWPSHKPYVNNLHHCVNTFWAGPYAFWLNIDADNPPIENPLDLIELDLDIIGLPTPVWHFKGDRPGERPLFYNAFDYDGETGAYREHRPCEGLQEVDAVGTGCLLMARRVFAPDEMRRGAFHRTWREDGTMEKGNDIAFSERARRNGLRLWAHYDYPCDHFSELSMREMTRAFMELYEGVA